MALSGAIHVDGFLDTCDAVFASVTIARRQEILKDPRHGTFALAYFAVAVVFWVAALFSLPAASLAQACALAAGAARLGAVCIARERRPPLPLVALNALAVIGIAFAVATWAWVVVPTVVATALVAGKVLRRRLGTLTGDAYGFTITVCEIVSLIALVFVLQPR
jgi:adenosylcobinamide-GDP ribazoletransferase